MPLSSGLARRARERACLLRNLAAVELREAEAFDPVDPVLARHHRERASQHEKAAELADGWSRVHELAARRDAEMDPRHIPDDPHVLVILADRDESMAREREFAAARLRRACAEWLARAEERVATALRENAAKLRARAHELLNPPPRAA